MKIFLGILVGLIFCIAIPSQDILYHPDADADKDIQVQLESCKKENKNLIIQVGGNWCKWCLLFNSFIQETPEVKKMIDDRYEYYHLNFSKENKNQEILDRYGNPEKLGFPVLVFLNQEGKVLHIQETGSLEEGEWYNTEKVLSVLHQWQPNTQDEFIMH